MRACVGVDATCWGLRRGYGRFLRSLLTATLAIDQANDYVFFVDSDSDEFPLPESRARIVRARCEVPTTQAASADGHRALRDMWNLSRAIAAEKLDLFYFPSDYSYIPLTNRAPKIVTVHDVIAELHPELIFPTLRSKLFWRAKLRMACAQARLIVTVSEYSRRCLEQHLRISPSRLRVVSEASDPEFRRLEQPDASRLYGGVGLEPGARFLTYVGGFGPHKNISLLVDVFRELHSQSCFKDVSLLLIGDYETDTFYSCYGQVKHQVEELGLGRQVLFPGYVRDPDLAVLLNLTEALVLPSFCEGFGLPAVEAAACGAPTVVTTESPLKELLGDGAIAVSPYDRRQLLEALTEILGDDRRKRAMSEAALAAAARLSWENSARQLLAVFDEVCQRREATA